jgi:hypothetical protein
VIFLSGGLVYAVSTQPLKETAQTTSHPFPQSRIETEQQVINSKVLQLVFVSFLLSFLVLFSSFFGSLAK